MKLVTIIPRNECDRLPDWPRSRTKDPANRDRRGPAQRRYVGRVRRMPQSDTIANKASATEDGSGVAAEMTAK